MLGLRRGPLGIMQALSRQTFCATLPSRVLAWGSGTEIRTIHKPHSSRMLSQSPLYRRIPTCLVAIRAAALRSPENLTQPPPKHQSDSTCAVNFTYFNREILQPCSQLLSSGNHTTRVWLQAKNRGISYPRPKQHASSYNFRGFATSKEGAWNGRSDNEGTKEGTPSLKKTLAVCAGALGVLLVWSHRRELSCEAALKPGASPVRELVGAKSLQTEPDVHGWLQDLWVDVKMVVLVSLFTVCGPILSLGWIFLPLRYMTLFWAVYIMTQMLPSFHSHSFEKLGARLCRDTIKYCIPFEVRKEADLDPERPHIFGLHPHGRLFVGAGALMGNRYEWYPELYKARRHIFFTGTPLLFRVPFLGNYMDAVGAISVDRKTIVSKLSKGHSVVITVGGIDEVLEGTFDDQDVLYLKKRLGFCKVAIDTGADLVPLYVFGENQMFQHSSKTSLEFWRWINANVAKLGAPFPIVGRWGLPIPYRRPMTIVLGKPIVPKEGETPEQLHARYTAALQELYERHVGSTHEPHRKLVLK